MMQRREYAPKKRKRKRRDEEVPALPKVRRQATQLLEEISSELSWLDEELSRNDTAMRRLRK